jgi:sarcosine oxidase subunit alpha
MNNRILHHPILGKLTQKKAIRFTFDGISYQGYEGDSIASALLANGIRTLRVHEESGTPRGIYCNIGHCYECRVCVDQVHGVRACMVEITANMVVESGKKQPTPLKKAQATDELPRTYADFEARGKDDKEADSHG